MLSSIPFDRTLRCGLGLSTTRTVDDVGHTASIVFPAGLVMAAFAAAMLVASGARLGALAILGLVYCGVVIAASGHVLIRWTLDTTCSSIALVILLGSVATSLFLTGGCLLTGRGASTIFLGWSVLVAVMTFLTYRDLSPFKAVDAVNPFRLVRRMDLRDVASSVAIGVVVAIWCRRVATLLPTFRSTGVVSIWSDAFIHATEIAQFGDPLAVGRSSFLLVDQPILFYHYASYMLPAAVARLVDLPAFGLVTSLLIPYGILLAALGCYAFATTMANQGTALLAPMALLLLPDAASIGLRNGFFGFHWLLFTAPGSGYGLGVAFTALMIVAMWRVDRRTSSLGLALIVTAALFEFRAHIFVLFAPALAITILWETDLVRRHARPIAWAMLCAAVVGAVCVAVVPLARQTWLHFSAFDRFMEIVHTGMSPTAYDGIYETIEREYGRETAWFAGFWALIPIALGAITIALPVAMTLAIRRTGWQRLDSFPIWCAITWLGLVVFAPSAHGDFTEYQHRPFVLVYAVALVWTILWLDRALHATEDARFRSRSVVIFRTLLCAALCASVAMSVNKDPARPTFAWGKQYFGTSVEPGLLEAATFVRRRAVAGDAFALIPVGPSNQATDAATRFAALSDVPAYLARPGIQVIHGQDRRAAVEQRLAVLKHIETANSLDAAIKTLRAVDVKFLVALGDHGPLFDPDGSRALFRTAGAAVYATPSFGEPVR
jgi:hypothetical protein